MSCTFLFALTEVMVHHLGLSTLLASLILSTAIVWAEFLTDFVHDRAASIRNASLHGH